MRCAWGSPGRARAELHPPLGARFTDRGALEHDERYETSQPGVFVAGDAGRGQSLIVWAIAEGRSAAARVDEHLMGETQLPAPVRPTDVGMHV